MMWKQFFMNIDSNKDSIYNFRIIPYNRFQKHCYEWYQYKLLKNNTTIFCEEVEQNNLIHLQYFFN